MSVETFPGFQFQFDVLGRLQHALISHEALVKCFGGSEDAPELAYPANKLAIHQKAREVFMSGEVRSPLLLTTEDFEASEK